MITQTDPVHPLLANVLSFEPPTADAAKDDNDQRREPAHHHIIGVSAFLKLKTHENRAWVKSARPACGLQIRHLY